MKKVLYILGLLGDEDVDWLVSAGTRTRFPPGDALIREGVGNEALFLMISGTAGVEAAGKQLGTVGAGEVLGEISLLDSRPPTATVRAKDEVIALKVPFASLRGKMDSDTKFASRFYKALGMFLAQRMRSVTLLATGHKLEDGLADDVELPDEIDPEMLEEVTLAGARFRMLIDRLKSR